MTIEKVKQLAHEKYGKTLTDEQATAYTEKYGKLSDSELDNVSGGCDSDALYACPECGSEKVLVPDSGDAKCYGCGYGWKV